MRLCASLCVFVHVCPLKPLKLVVAVKQGFCCRFTATEAHLSETTKGGCSRDFSPQSTTPLFGELGELGGSRESVGLGNPAKLSVILRGGLLLFFTCCPAFQSNSIDDMGDGDLAAAHMACNVFSLLSSSMKRENETFSHFIQIFYAFHDCFIQ